LISLVAKDVADIIILDNNFASCIQAVVWGRCTFDNIRKFLQFQLTVNAVALTFTFIAACKGEDPPLNAVMMLWVNLIMDTFGALALGTESPDHDKLLRRLPFKRDASLISDTMWRNIIVQSIFQLAVLLFLQGDYARKHIFADEQITSDRHMDTIIFNVFVLCQVFNELNSRSIDDDDYNILFGLHKNLPFLFIIIVTVVAQYLWVAFGGDFIGTVPLSVEHWKKCAAIASISLTLGYIMRLIPQRFVTLFKSVFKMEDAGSDSIELSDFQKDIQSKATRALNENKNRKGRVNLSRQFVNFIYKTIVYVGPYVAFMIVDPKCELELRNAVINFFSRDLND
jgi:Ca2+-transporting ATPase